MEDYVVGQGVPPVASCAAASGESVMTVRPNLRPANATVRPHQCGSETQAERYAQFLKTKVQTEVRAWESLKPCPGLRRD